MPMWHREDPGVFMYSTVDNVEGCQGYGWACHGLLQAMAKWTCNPNLKSELSLEMNESSQESSRTKLGPRYQGNSRTPREQLLCFAYARTDHMPCWLWSLEGQGQDKNNNALRKEAKDIWAGTVCRSLLFQTMRVSVFMYPGAIWERRGRTETPWEVMELIMKDSWT